MRSIVIVFLLATLCHPPSLLADIDTASNDPEPTHTGEAEPNPAVITTCEQIADARTDNSALDREQFLLQCSAEAEQFLRQHQLITQSLSQTP